MTLPARLLALLALIGSCTLAAGQLPTGDPQPQPQPQPQTPEAVPAAAAEPLTPPPSPEQISALTARLGDDDFKTRESAQIELTKLAESHPDVTLDPILEAYLDCDVLEARFRLRGILYRSKYAEFIKVPRGFVGIVMNPSFARGKNGELIHAIQVMRVVENSAAEKFGLQLMDQITGIDGKPLDPDNALGDFASYVSGKSAGDEVELSILRRTQEQQIKLTLGQRPDYLLGQDPRLQDNFEADFKRWLDESSDRLRGKK